MADLTAKKCRGINLQARDAAATRWYPTATEPAIRVELWMHDADKPAEFAYATLVAVAAPGQLRVPVDFNPAQDRPKILRVISYSAAGVPSVRYLSDAPATTVDFSRQDDSSKASTSQPFLDPLSIGVFITAFSEHTVARQAQYADDTGFTTALNNEILTGADAISSYYYVTRPSAAPQPGDTKYFRVRHSTTGSSGPWTAWSDTLPIIFDPEP